MVFQSKIYDDIVANGNISLTAKRDFGYFGNCDVKIFLADKEIMSFHISGSKNQVSKLQNGLDFPYEMIGRNEAVSGPDRFRLNINRNYLFSGNYGDLAVNGNTVAKLRLKQRLFGVELTIQPENNLLNDETKLKSAILILANIADLDGSI